MTEQGVWGFNPEYHLNLLLLGLPLEEWLFFIVIPYASVFLHETIVNLYPNLKLPKKTSKVLSIILIIMFSSLSIVYNEKAYTFYIFTTTTVALILSSLDKSDIMEHFYVTYLVILVPFFIVNSILTGSFIEREVVWYNDSENLGIRILTIPIEDFAYGFSLILLVLLTRNFLKKLHYVLWA
jgi:lycopene cyclase domain-containing protein